MNCNHLIELNATTGKYDGEIDLDYCCDICDRSVPEESVVHITKAQYQLMQDVVKAGREMSEYMMKRIDRNFNIAGTDDLGELWNELDEALDALDKGDNERGL